MSLKYLLLKCNILFYYNAQSGYISVSLNMYRFGARFTIYIESPNLEKRG